MDWTLLPAAIQLGAVLVQWLGRERFTLRDLAKIDLGLGVVCFTAAYAFWTRGHPGSGMVQAGCALAYWSTAAWLLVRIRQKEQFERIVAEMRLAADALARHNAEILARNAAREGREPGNVRAGAWAPPGKNRAGSVPQAGGGAKEKPPTD